MPTNLDFKRLESKTSLERLQIFLVVVPVLALIILVQTYGVNVPHQDQWEIIPFFQRYRSDELEWGDVWAQHNEHRIFFPRLIMLGLAVLSNWNIMWELYLNIVLGILIFLFGYLLIQHSCIDVNKRLQQWLTVLFAWMVFSPVQWENWLWGWQIQWFLNILSVLMTIWAITAWPSTWPVWLGTLVAAGSATIASYSLANGMLIWIIALLLLLALEGLKPRFIIFVVCSVSVPWLYFLNYKKPSHHPTLLAFMGNAMDFFRFICVYLGRSLSSGSRDVSMVVGLLLVCLFIASTVYMLRQEYCHRQRCLGWVALGLYPILTAIVTAIGRLGFGVTIATSSRYTTISTLFAFSTILLVSMALTYKKPAPTRYRYPYKLLVALLGIYVIFMVSSNYVTGIRRMSETNIVLVKTKECLEHLDSSTDDCLRASYAYPNLVRERARYLKLWGWGGL